MGKRHKDTHTPVPVSVLDPLTLCELGASARKRPLHRQYFTFEHLLRDWAVSFVTRIFNVQFGHDIQRHFLGVAATGGMQKTVCSLIKAYVVKVIPLFEQFPCGRALFNSTRSVVTRAYAKKGLRRLYGPKITIVCFSFIASTHTNTDSALLDTPN